jgi:hypothetical protein
MAKYRKKPVVIDAIQWNGENEIQIMDFVGKKLKYARPPHAVVRERDDLSANDWRIYIPTLEGEMTAIRMDWIIKGIHGEFYPVKDEIFKKTYEPVSDNKEYLESIGNTTSSNEK